MGRPKLGAEYKKPSDYHYDYPKNREVSVNLTADDKLIISQKTGFSLQYVRDWCQGRRKNTRIEEWAIKIMRINQRISKAKLRELNNQDKGK